MGRLLKSGLMAGCSSIFRGIPVRFAVKKKKVYPDYDGSYRANDPKMSNPYAMIPPKFPHTNDMTPLAIAEIRTRMLSVLRKYEKINVTENFNWKVFGHFID